MKPILDCLQESVLFEGLTPHEILEISDFTTVHQLDRGESTTLEESRGAVFIVIDGLVNVLRCRKDHETFLFALEEGDIYGHPPLRSPSSDHFSRISAASSSDLISLKWDGFIEYLQKRPKIATLLLERVLVSSAEKFATISREYSHMVEGTGVSEEAIDKLFDPDENDQSE